MNRLAARLGVGAGVPRAGVDSGSPVELRNATMSINRKRRLAPSPSALPEIKQQAPQGHTLRSQHSNVSFETLVESAMGTKYQRAMPVDPRRPFEIPDWIARHVVSSPRNEAPTPPKEPKPRWEGRTLRYGETVCCIIRKASQMGRILDVFEEEKWVNSVDSPFPRGQLKQHLDNLRRKLKNSPIEIYGNDADSGLRWRRR